jgi:hypothetical protein
LPSFLLRTCLLLLLPARRFVEIGHPFKRKGRRRTRLRVEQEGRSR